MQLSAYCKFFQCDHNVKGTLNKAYITFISILIHVLCFNEPVHVADHVLLHLLFLLGHLQFTTTHSLLSLFRELTVMCKRHIGM